MDGGDIDMKAVRRLYLTLNKFLIFLKFFINFLKFPPPQIENDESIKAITNNKLSIEDFSTIKVVGKGSYGKVLLVRKNEDQKVYAMKILKKKQMIKRNQVEHIKTERRILELIDNPFIIKLKYAFQNPQKLYLVMEYCPGGELFFHIQRVERFNEEAVKFYASQLVLAIAHLHANNIIYRE